MEGSLQHVFRFIFGVSYAWRSPPILEGVKDCSEVNVLRENLAICHAFRHRAVEGAAEEFRGGVECLFQRDAERGWNCPVDGQFDFTTLWIEGSSPRMVSG